MKVYKSIYAQMAYSFVSGILLLTIPNAVITLIGFKPTSEPWIYAIGLMALMLCFYYFQIARSESKKAVLGTVYGRWFFTAVAALSALAGFVPKLIVPMMMFEAVLAFWAWKETKSNRA